MGGGLEDRKIEWGIGVARIETGEGQKCEGGIENGGGGPTLENKCK